jgi:hypothetical protein
MANRKLTAIGQRLDSTAAVYVEDHKPGALVPAADRSACR